MSDRKRVAVLMTCYNRRETTMKCLQALYGQDFPEHLEFEVYLVDDGCTDGTHEAVREEYPRVKVLQGNGNLYWCGGMRVAFAEALKHDFDYYLWLSDDTVLFSHALSTLLDTSYSVEEQFGHQGIIVGSAKDTETGEHAYGGVINRSHWRLRFARVVPSDRAQPCDTMNGNVVLIPREIAKAVGNLSPDYTHGIGDYDYGLRAKAKAFECWIAPGYVGTCSANPNGRLLKDKSVPVKDRLKTMCSPTGLPPTREWMLFTRRHAKVLWPWYWMRTLVRACFPRLWIYFRTNRPERCVL